MLDHRLAWHRPFAHRLTAREFALSSALLALLVMVAVWRGMPVAFDAACREVPMGTSKYVVGW